MLKAKCLRKTVVPPSLIEYPSPANLQPTRLALHVDGGGSSCCVYIASGCRIYKVKISVEDSLIIQGKESLLIPQETQVIESGLVDRCPHRSEIQSIVLAESKSTGCLVLGSVDSFGHLIVSKMDTSGKDVEKMTFSVSPQGCGVGEGSWAGICFSPSQWSMAAVAHSFCRSIDVYDQDIHLRAFRTLWYPSSVSFMPTLCGGNDNSMIAVTEGCQLSIWDLRMKEKGGCVHRMCGSVGDILYAVCYSSNGYIAAGGTDRTVTVYDPRRLLDLLSHQLTLIISTYRELTMRCSVENGKKMRKHFHLGEIQTGLVLVSVPAWMFWGDGVIQVAYLWPTLAKPMVHTWLMIPQTDYHIECFSLYLITPFTIPPLFNPLAPL